MTSSVIGSKPKLLKRLLELKFSRRPTERARPIAGDS
jgi:hypothetical protein